MMSIPTIFKKIINRSLFSVSSQKGQSIIILAFAFLGLIALLGLALDLGLVYIERTRIKRAVDAATLAGVVELPNEEQAFIRAINYLDQNGYRLTNANGQPQINIYIRGCAHGEYLSSAAPGTTNELKNRGAVLTQTAHLYYPPGGVAVPDPVAEFTIDTRSYQGTDGDGNFYPDNQQCDVTKTPPLFGTAGKFHVQGEVPVQMNFMQFFGFGEVPVSDQSVAQNITQLDVSIVIDVSGSMQFDTICHGCYEEFDVGTTNWWDFNYGYTYPLYDTVNSRTPKTFIFPIPVDHLPAASFQSGGSAGVGSNTGQLCNGRDGNGSVSGTVSGSGGSATRRYIVMEAELYTKNNSIYDIDSREPGRGYWAVQHVNYRTVDRMFDSDKDGYETGATPILPSYTRNSWVSHHPYKAESREQIGTPGNPDYLAPMPFGHNYTLAEAQANQSPSLDYEFVTSSDWNGADTRVWARMQGETTIYWAVYTTSLGIAPAPDFNPLNPAPVGGVIQANRQTPSCTEYMYGGASSGCPWRWRELTDGSPTLPLTNTTKYTLRIWAGRVGLDIDQIVIGNANDIGIFGTSTNYDNGVTYPTNTKLKATPGSAFGEACNRCNPIYGQVIANPNNCLPPSDNGANKVSAKHLDAGGSYDLRRDQLYSDYQPIRGAKEALKRFITRLNPQFDQVGIVAYNNTTESRRSLDMRCLRSNPNDCYQGTTPISYTDVLRLIEKLPANGGTNIAQGMRDGLNLMGVTVDGVSRAGTLPALPANCAGTSCARGASAKRVMILMTDGVANVYPAGCSNEDLFTPNLSTSTGNTNTDTNNDNLNRARDCVIYYAQKAAKENIILYTIGLGNGVDVGILEKAAEVGKGQYFAAATPAQLDEIFGVILKSISVRLVE